jgi:hypothetical protein
MTLINVRKLAALDIVFHGPRLILAEFGLAVLGSLALGVLTLVHAYTGGGTLRSGMTLLGAYFLSIAMNYVPLLVHGIDVVRKRSARNEVQHELAAGASAARRYGVQQVLLLVPLAVVVLALVQARPGRRDRCRTG